MNYLPLNEFKYAWIFRHQSMPVAENIKLAIKPMTEERASVVWDTFISKHETHHDHFTDKDWPKNHDNWIDNGNWEVRWESDDLSLPELITSHLNWENNTVVYYCLNRKMIIETTWGIFQQCWKNFLFVDDGSFLLGKKRKEVVQFTSDGNYQVGLKPV